MGLYLGAEIKRSTSDELQLISPSHPRICEAHNPNHAVLTPHVQINAVVQGYPTYRLDLELCKLAQKVYVNVNVG